MNHSLQEMIAYKKELEKESLANLSIAPATCYLPLMHSPHYDLISQYVSPREKNYRYFRRVLLSIYKRSFNDAFTSVFKRCIT